MPGSPVRAVPWEKLDGERLAPGGASVQVNLPTRATIVELAAETEDVYFLINGGGAAASAASEGYILAGTRELIGPLAGFLRLDIFQAQGGYTHLIYLKEHGFIG